MTELSRILAEHQPVKVCFDRRNNNAGLPHISDPSLTRKPVWYVYEGRACVFGPKRDGLRPVLFIEKRKSSYEGEAL